MKSVQKAQKPGYLLLLPLLACLCSNAFAQTYQFEAHAKYLSGDGEDTETPKTDITTSSLELSGTFYFSPVEKTGAISGLDYMQRISSVGVSYTDAEDEEKTLFFSTTDSSAEYSLFLSYYLPDLPLYVSLEYEQEDIDREEPSFPDETIESPKIFLNIGFFAENYLSLGVALIDSERKYTLDTFNNSETDMRGIFVKNFIPHGKDLIGFEFLILQGDIKPDFGSSIDVDSTSLSFSYSSADYLEGGFSYIKTGVDLPGADDMETIILNLRKPVLPNLQLDLEYSSTSVDKEDTQGFGLTVIAQF